MNFFLVRRAVVVKNLFKKFESPLFMGAGARARAGVRAGKKTKLIINGPEENSFKNLFFFI